jgi:mono/diheme cytochrome c family protein
MAGAGLPCAVADLLNRRCTACHSDPPRAGASVPLITIDHLAARSISDPGPTVIERALVLMRDEAMPPSPLAAVPPTELAEVELWVAAGMPATACSDPTVAEPSSSPFDGTGLEVFAAVCATCHGAAAEGTDRGYELRHPSRAYATFVLRHGRPGVEFVTSEMDAYPAELLGDAQLSEMWDWLDSFPQPTTGEGLYQDYCANCHGEDALGGVVDQGLDGETLTNIVDKVRAGNGDRAYAARGDYMPSWTAEQLNDAELELVADYLGGL